MNKCYLLYLFCLVFLSCNKKTTEEGQKILAVYTSKIFILLLIAISYSCTQITDTEKYQKSRDKIVPVKDKIKEIKIEEVLIGRMSQPYLIDKYLIIIDHASPDQLIHLFDKNDFHYLASTAYKGQGPGEIATIGHIEYDKMHHKIYVTDHGKQKIFSYNPDSILANPNYMPEVKMEMKISLFPDEYKYINDTLCIGRVIKPIGTNNYKPTLGKWNMQTGDIKLMKYEHPDIKKVRFTSAVSAEHNMYLQCYTQHDLMTICNLDGDLIHNIYGPHWNPEITQTGYYWNAQFCDDKIIASFSGGDHRTEDKYPTQFLVFNLNGDYLKTLDIGYKMLRFCYDPENNRLILCMNDEIQFGYLDLDGVI